MQPRRESKRKLDVTHFQRACERLSKVGVVALESCRVRGRIGTEVDCVVDFHKFTKELCMAMLRLTCFAFQHKAFPGVFTDRFQEAKARLRLAVRGLETHQALAHER